ncbi:MAG: ABC transporter ATP-binding protein, partial [Flavobacteriales bacterium]|nr:ABC transporter ATP-binding protein [Flavobacteriales bacterium]
FKGRVIEKGPAKNVLTHPKENYTRGLLACRPPIDSRPVRLPTVNEIIANPDQVWAQTDSQQRLKRIHSQQSRSPVLEVVGLSKIYSSKTLLGKGHSETRAVDCVSFAVYPGETFGLVGESGCGKTTLSRMILGLIKPTEGKIKFEGQSIDQLSRKAMTAVRRKMQIIFQDPYSSLNPGIRIGAAILEPMQAHKILSSKKERQEKVIELLLKVGLQASDFDKYPHEFSGGQRQRIVIARALALKPSFLVCDESVSALDVSVQAQILNLLNDLKDEFGLTLFFISHDLAVIKYMSDRVMVMNQGRVEELEEADALFHSPKSKYTQKLINSIPGI